MRWLDWLDRLAQTPERAALRGGILKRAGERATRENRAELLKAAAGAYRRAVELGSKEKGAVHYYAGLNLAALSWASGLARDDRAEAERLVREIVAPSRASAAAERDRGRTLWNEIAACEADLLEALLLDQLEPARASIIAGNYDAVMSDIGSPPEHASVRSQIAFLLACAEDTRSKTGLQTIAEAIKER